MKQILIIILLLFPACGNQITDYKWVSFPSGVQVTFTGMTSENTKARQIWLNSEACVGHAQREPELIVVNGNFYCGDVYPCDGCASPEKSIVVITEDEYTTDLVYYHENMHVLLHTLDEDLVRTMAAECKRQND